ALEKRDWREYFAFYMIALVGTIYLGVNTFAQFTLPYQLGFIGVLLTAAAVIFDQIQLRREIRREGLTKTEHEVEDIAGWYLIPWQARLRTNAYHFVIGLVVALALLLGIYALTYRFGFLFTYPVSWSYLIYAFIVAFLFSFGIEWVLRRRIQTLIDQVAPYYDPHKTSAIYLALIIILPASVTLSLALFDAAYLPAIFLLLFPIIGICGIINAYLYDHTNSLMVTVTFATCVIGWVLAGCLYPGFF
ncbi:MAG TPA: hypothetical protein VKK79_09895, partial [Candidatus Lokiarchaeia archaeon]|nr:hypothetical protein [Candidatus Lokiarchaeia archaeon]